ncbi:hypothetical protein [Bradyrhizobium canariense]|uniref:hypothetical protein n=1 Tax=Bradyrhizobium canariense TaxID=255045 RepID=UPI0011BAB07F|nr:hypothetical protein [Bradyrhizobium canariense]
MLIERGSFGKTGGCFPEATAPPCNLLIELTADAGTESAGALQPIAIEQIRSCHGSKILVIQLLTDGETC